MPPSPNPSSWTLCRRADFSSKSPFHAQEETYQQISGQITDQIEELASLVTENKVDFSRFRSLTTAYSEKLEELSFVISETSYRRDELHTQLSDLQSILKTFGQGSLQHQKCIDTNQWMDCLLSEVYKLRLSFMNIYGDFDKGQVKIDHENRVAAAKNRLVALAKKAKTMRSKFRAKWRQFEEAVVSSDEFLVELAAHNTDAEE
ncbi:hypothetical protein JCM33374_g5295 [Metschnikowia sp. JCM 33374]|nr:hypothetical protein JCM33374_g5295 [Metschnikowia sp. JCM 33374]